MDNNRRIIFVAIIALVITAISLGMAIVALRNDVMNGANANIGQSLWNVKFDASSLSKENIGNAKGELPSITATTIGEFSVNLKKAGDAVRYTLAVENHGLLDAYIAAIFRGKPKCAGRGNNSEADANLVCDNLIYTLSNDMLTGKLVTVGDILTKKTGLATKKMLILNIEYPLGTNVEPMDIVTVTIPALTIIYNQYK